MFDEVAHRYDVTNAILSGGNAPLWRIATTKAVDPKPGERILDVACGTGTSTAALAKGEEIVGRAGPLSPWHLSGFRLAQLLAVQRDQRVVLASERRLDRRAAGV